MHHAAADTMTKKDFISESSPKEEPRSPLRKNGAKFLRFARRNSPKKQSDGDVVSQEQAIPPEPPHIRTAILTSYDPLLQQPPEYFQKAQTRSSTVHVSSRQEQAPPQAQPPANQKKPWFNFTLCARPSDVYDGNMDCSSSSSSENDLPDDPTVQESIECVFAHQLEESEGIIPPDITSPAALLQSRTPSRIASRSIKSQRPYHDHSLVHLGTFDPAVGRVLPPPKTQAAPSVSCSTASLSSASTKPSSDTCSCQHGIRTPQVSPEFWPQRPLMMRPTPGSGMRILGIRFSSSKQYLWTERDPQDTILWYKRLYQYWNLPLTLPHLPKCCPECMILPINNGNEPRGEALVVDFESPLFRGTMMVRVRYAEGTTREPYDDDKGYFQGMNRRYQIIVRGQFLEEIPFTQSVAGIQLERPVGNLPPKWITNGALKVVSFFAPQLKANIEGPKPYSISPFGSTPQTLRVDDHAEYNETMEDLHHEPIHDHHTLLGKASKHPSSLHRARWRKKQFDRLYVAESPTPVTMPHKIYTFEFLQHLLNMQDFTIELGSMLGHVELKEALNGQPLQIMARHVDSHKIWSFDIWHECLYEDSKKYDPVLE